MLLSRLSDGAWRNSLRWRPSTGPDRRLGLEASTIGITTRYKQPGQDGDCPKASAAEVDAGRGSSIVVEDQLIGPRELAREASTASGVVDLIQHTTAACIVAPGVCR